MGLEFDYDEWVRTGRPGGRFQPASERRSAPAEWLFGEPMTAEGVAKEAHLDPRTVKNWARQSIDLIESWRWHYQSPAGQRLQQEVFEDIKRWALNLRGPMPKFHEPTSWCWIALPSDAPAEFRERVLLRPIPVGSPARDVRPFRLNGDTTVGFAIVRPALGRGRGRGWLFQKARLPSRRGYGSLPPWLRHAAA